MNNMYNSLHPSLDWIGLEIFNIKKIYFFKSKYLFIYLDKLRIWSLSYTLYFNLIHNFELCQFAP